MWIWGRSRDNRNFTSQELALNGTPLDKGLSSVASPVRKLLWCLGDFWNSESSFYYSAHTRWCVNNTVMESQGMNETVPYKKKGWNLFRILGRECSQTTLWIDNCKVIQKMDNESIHLTPQEKQDTLVFCICLRVFVMSSFLNFLGGHHSYSCRNVWERYCRALWHL